MKYGELAELYDALNGTTKRLEKTYILSEFLKKVDDESISDVLLLVQGKVFPQWNSKEIGVSTKLVIKAVSLASGSSSDKIEQEWKKKGDLGDAAASILGKKTQMSLFKEDISISSFIKEMRKIADLSGQGSTDVKVKGIAKFLGSASPKEMRYIVRTVLEDMRTGVSEGILRDAIIWAFLKEEAKVIYGDGEKASVADEDRENYNNISGIVQNALDITNDFSEVAEIAKKDGLAGLEKIRLRVGKPLKLMLFPKAADVKEAFESVGKPCAFEYKYDGFRVQVHKKKGEIKIFTRRLDEVTKQFPDVVEVVNKHIAAEDFIIDGEVVGYDAKKGHYLPFQNMSQRIRRKYDIEDMASKFPVELDVFDILYLDGQSLMSKGFEERRALLKNIVKEKDKNILLAKQLITEDEDEAMKFYSESLKKGFEGVMAKSLSAAYRPGRWTGYGVKLKPVMEELDLVIVKAEWGTGKRGTWLTSYTVACTDESGELVEIGKVSTGLKEIEGEKDNEGEGVTYSEMTERLKPLILSEGGKEVEVKPEIILEVHYEEIQRSPSYSSGYALRFPRVVRVRDDKGLDEIADITQVDVLFKKQKR